MSDQLTDGRRFRILTVLDDCTRECLALVADISLSGARAGRELDRLVIERGKPTMVSDNRSELTSNAILNWADQSRRMAPHCAGKAHAETFIESFNGRLRTHRGRAFQRASWKTACSSHVSKDGGQRGILRREVDHHLRFKGREPGVFP